MQDGITGNSITVVVSDNLGGLINDCARASRRALQRGENQIGTPRTADDNMLVEQRDSHLSPRTTNQNQSTFSHDRQRGCVGTHRIP